MSQSSKLFLEDLFRDGVNLQEANGESSPLGAFINPFKDVASAAKLTGQEALAAGKFGLKLGLLQLFGLTPNRVRKARASYENEVSKLEDKWKPIVDRTEKALGSSDISMVAFMMSPAAYLAHRGIQAAGGATKFTDQTAGGDRWNSSEKSSGGADRSTSAPPRADTRREPAEEKKGILTRMMNLFMLESVSPEDVLIEKKEAKGSQSLQNMKKYFKQSKINDKVEEAADEYLRQISDFYAAIVTDAVPKIKELRNVQQGKPSKVDKIDAQKKLTPELAKKGEKNLINQATQALSKVGFSDEDVPILKQSDRGRKLLKLRQDAIDSLRDGVNKLSQD